MDKGIEITDYANYLVNEFEKEEDMCRFIDEHAKEFAENVLEIEYIGHKKEYYITNSKGKAGNRPRVDFAFFTENGIILCECKNPSNVYSESVVAVGQSLTYLSFARLEGIQVKRFCIISTNYLPIIGQVIRDYNLPLEYFIFSKSHHLRLKTGYNGV